VPVVEAVSVCNHPSGETIILVLVQVLYLGECQEPSLLCPVQMRPFGIVMDNVLNHLSVNCKFMHIIYILDLDLRLPLEMDGVISYINTHYSNESEIENCILVNLTSSAMSELHSENFL
jgi:hypothetical protein